MNDLTLPTPGANKDIWGPLINDAVLAIKAAVDALEGGAATTLAVAQSASNTASAASTAATAATAAVADKQKVIKQYTDTTAAAAGLAANEFADGDLIVVLASV